MKSFKNFLNNQYFKTALSWLTNKYVLVIVGFVIYMSFFDQYRWLDMIKYQKEINALEEKKQFYKSEIIRIDAATKNILTDKEQLEKFARENFLMKKKSEVLFLIDEDKL